MGLYTITTRADGIVLTAVIWNGDHQNHVTHTEPSSINSYEANVAQMQIEVDPAPLGIPSLPAALSGELERLRFALTTLKKIISAGTMPAHWYTAIGDFSSSILLPVVACRRELSGGQAIPNNTPTTVNFNTTVYDTTGTMVDGAASIKAPVEGTYLVGGTLGFGDGATTGPSGDFQLTLRQEILSGDTVTLTPIATNQVFSLSSIPKYLTVETIARFTVDRGVSLRVLQSNGSTKNTIATAEAKPALWMALIGR